MDLLLKDEEKEIVFLVHGKGRTVECILAISYIFG